MLGYPRIGRNRELKRAVESYWAGRTSAEDLARTERDLRHATHQRLLELGLGAGDASIPESASLYDQVLDATVLLGAVPQRFAGRSGLDLYFALARGDAQVPPEEMTKWFDTNYHYLVPEIGPDTPLAFTDRTVVDRFVEAQGWGVTVRPTLVGPLTWLALAKPSEDAPVGWSPLSRLDEVVAVYSEVLGALAEAGAPWVQLDEPALVSDNLPEDREVLIEAAGHAHRALAAVGERPQLFVTTPYGDGRAALPTLAGSGVEAVQLDLVRGAAPRPGEVDLSRVVLAAGVIEGRNIWHADLEAATGALDELKALGAADLAVTTSTSLQHVPHDTALEQWADPELDRSLHAWLAFADQKVGEVATLARGLGQGWGSIDEDLRASREALAARAVAPGVSQAQVRGRVAALTAVDRTRIEYPVREAAQTARLGLPELPTTTIGSFPQTTDIRRARAAHVRGELSDADYEARIKEEITDVIRLQEEIGLDVLVHGEPERNDMVQYFAELLEGFAVTSNGWVQSYG
ncbi:MAG: 5-methyltetrahydropteroyltriglutamate--homocysteine S-methyltransferase, partial [Actinomyces sp.]|nr:5-methyltetrahydropteroyltriglutamate--homocysteine S-methyltransferase [Actinomyces sp.]